MKSKSEASDKVNFFINLIETQFDKKVKRIRSDKDPRFLLMEFYFLKCTIDRPQVYVYINVV